MYTEKVLDHGFVTLRNLAGPTRRQFVTPLANGEPQDPANLFGGVELRPFDADDTDPSQAARMSFGQMDSERTYEQDMKLASYLLKNGHTSPFEMIGVWVEVKVPIFIDRQMVRHRTWKRNESSGRYVQLPAEWYIPQIVGGKAADKKQGQENNLSKPTQEWFRRALATACATDYKIYEKALEKGVAPEHARMFLHLNHYVHWLGQVDLANLYKFLALRAHSHAQIEAQMYAEAIIKLLKPHIPGLMELFEEFVRKE